MRLLSPVRAAASSRYTITDVGLVGANVWACGSGINHFGEVSGYVFSQTSASTATSHAFIYRNSGAIDLGVPKAGDTPMVTGIPRRLDDHGAAVATVHSSAGFTPYVTTAVAGKPVWLRLGRSGWASGINNSGTHGWHDRAGDESGASGDLATGPAPGIRRSPYLGAAVTQRRLRSTSEGT